jgi:hypothetical protein
VRVVFAGLFIFAGLAGGIVLFSTFFPHAPVWLLSTLMVSLLFGLTIAALILFNTPGGWRRNRQDPEVLVQQLQAKNLLAIEKFNAKRAFQVEEFEDEGSHYFVELEDGSVLFLSGQYLYDYETFRKGEEVVHRRRFPNTEFAIRRHSLDHYVVDILCNGSVIEPEVVAPPFDPDDFGTHRIPDDGQVIRDRTFEELKNERLKHSTN